MTHLAEAGKLKIDLAYDDRRFSNLEKTATIFAHADYLGKDLQIVHSNRYDEDGLIALFARYGLHHLESAWAAETPFYRCYLFERTKTRKQKDRRAT